MTVLLSPVDKVLCLQSVDVFKHATTEMLAYIGSVAQETSAPKGHVIYAEGDMSDVMYVLVKGHARLEKEGKEILTVSPGQSFGTWALFDNQPRAMTATALDDVQLLKIRSDDFYDLLSDHDDITRAIFRAVVEQMNQLMANDRSAGQKEILRVFA